MRPVRLPTPLAELEKLKQDIFDIKRRLRGLSGNTRPDPSVFGKWAEAWTNFGTNQSITQNTATPISFPNYGGSDGTWWTASAPTKLIVPPGFAGVYVMKAQATWAGGGTGYREVGITIDGPASPIEAARQPASSEQQSVTAVTIPIRLLVGAEITSVVYQNSTSAVNVMGASNWTNLALWRIE